MKKDSGSVFRSWKAIANYFDKSERTVRRWESKEGLPVRRHKHQSAARIFAYQNELDVWFTSRSQQDNSKDADLGKTLCMALLPFEKIIDDPDSTFVADALCQDIVTDLSYLPSVTMISYSSSRRLLQSDKDPAPELMSLSVQYYIEGSLQLAGKVWRIHIRLIELATQQVVWSAKYDEIAPDWQRLQQVIVAGLITSLPLSNLAHTLAHAGAARFNNNIAWEYLHKARTESLKWQPATIDRAIALLTSADKLVGGSALIQASLGRVYLQLRESGIDCSADPLEKVSKILEAIRATHPEALFTLSLEAWFFYIRGDLCSAVKALKRALKINPNDADALALVANCYLLCGQPSLAKPYIQTLQIVDPLTPLSRCMPGYYKLMTGDPDGAVSPYEEMLALDPSNNLARLFLVWVLATKRDTDRIGTICGGFDPHQESAFVTRLAQTFYYEGQNKPFTLSLTQEEEDCAKVNGMFARFTAFAFAATGQREQAIYWLSVATELGFYPFPYMVKHDRFFRPWHNLTAMKHVLGEMEKKWQAFSDNV